MKKWLTWLEWKEIAAHATLKMYKTLLSDTFFTLLTAERNDAITYFRLEHMKDGKTEISELPDDQGYEDAHLIQKLHFHSPIPYLLLISKSRQKKVRKYSEKKVSTILKEFLEKKKQWKSNKDVMTAVEEESADNPSNILRKVEEQLAKKNRHHKAHID